MLLLHFVRENATLIFLGILHAGRRDVPAEAVRSEWKAQGYCRHEYAESGEEEGGAVSLFPYVFMSF